MENQSVSISNQEMFDRAWKRLKSQGWKVAIEDGACQYLTESGLRCAWGHVDPEGTTLKHLDGRQLPLCGSVDALATLKKGIAGILDSVQLDFARSLQRCHDRSGDPNLETNMRSFAKEWCLSIPEESHLGG